MDLVLFPDDWQEEDRARAHPLVALRLLTIIRLFTMRSIGRATPTWRRDDISFMLAVTIQAINAHCDLVIRIVLAASSMANCDLVIACRPWAGRTTAFWRRDDIAFMSIVIIQVINAHCDLVVRIGLAVSGMANGELAINGYRWACRATVCRHWIYVVWDAQGAHSIQLC